MWKRCPRSCEKPSVVAIDVETTLRTSALCLIQIAGAQSTYLIDALELSDLAALARLLSATATTKVIHNAEFERRVLERHDLVIESVIDTRESSRGTHGSEANGGHSLRAVCARKLRIELDKREQTSDWARRPLSRAQIDYAALDAEIVLTLHERFRTSQGS